MAIDPTVGEDIADCVLAAWLECMATSVYLRRPDLMPSGNPQFWLRAAATRIRNLSSLIDTLKTDPIGFATKDLHPE